MALCLIQYESINSIHPIEFNDTRGIHPGMQHRSS